jgi:hypothetical protein
VPGTSNRDAEKLIINYHRNRERTLYQIGHALRENWSLQRTWLSIEKIPAWANNLNGPQHTPTRGVASRRNRGSGLYPRRQPGK